MDSDGRICLWFVVRVAVGGVDCSTSRRVQISDSIYVAGRLATWSAHGPPYTWGPLPWWRDTLPREHLSYIRIYGRVVEHGAVHSAVGTPR